MTNIKQSNTKINKDKVDNYRALCVDWLIRNASHLTLNSIKTGRDAWSIAHKAGVVEDAYKDRSIVDAHIQTALQQIFPSAIFLDPKRY